MQLVDMTTPVLNAISNALTITISQFQSFQSISNNGISINNIQTTTQNLGDIGTSIYTMEQLFEHARSTIETPLQPTIITPEIPNSNNQQSNPVVPVPAWQSNNSMQIFDTSGIQRYNQELTSAQNMANTLASTQASIAMKSSNSNIFPSNMGNDMEDIYQRVLKISQEMNRLSQQKINISDTGILNNTFETLRGHLNNAVSEQNSLNNAMKNMDISSANNAYERLVHNIDSAEVHIRDNINGQNNFNKSIQQGSMEASNLANKIKGSVASYLSIMGIKQGIESTVGSAMQLNQQQQTLNTMFGNADVGNAYFKQLQQYALDTGQSMEDLTASTRRYIGYTKNTDKLMNFNNIAQKMAVYDPEQGTKGAAYAINEAMSGSYTSLKMRFELSSADIEPLKDAVKQGNIDQIQDALNGIMAAKGITDEVLASFQDTAAFKFNKLVKTFKSKLTEAGSASLNVVKSIIDKVSNWLNSTSGTAMINGISTAVFYLMNILDIVITKAMQFGSFIADNWSIIAPIIFGIAGAMLTYNAILTVYNIISAISKGIEIAKTLCTAISTHATIAQTAAMTTATGVQIGYNAALLACPITWIILIIIALIAIVYAVVAAINEFTDQSISATGIIMGAFAVAGASIGNTLIAAYNLVVGVFVDIWNLCASFAEFFTNFLNDPIGSICRLFVNLADFVLGILERIADVIDTLFGSNLASAVSGWRDSMNSWTDKNIAAPKHTAPRIDKDTLQLDRLNYGDAWNAGYDLGVDIEKGFEMPKFDELKPSEADLGDWNSNQSDTLNSIDDSGKGTKSNTDDLKDSLEDDMKYLRDMAEMEVINRFTTAEIKVTMHNKNNINSTLDLDGITSLLTEKVYEEMQVAAEGVYN